VGNALHRGVSGGEKKRTTAGEMEFDIRYVTFLDEVTTGLDSAAAFDVIASKRSFAKTMVGFTGFAEAVLYWVNLSLLILFQAYLTQLAIFVSPSIEVATTLGVLINSIGLMMTGFNPPTLQIPQGYKWIYAIAPHRYTFSALVGVVFGDCFNDQLIDVMVAAASPGGVDSLDLSSYPLGCRIVKDSPAKVGEIPVKAYVEVVFGVKHEHIAQYTAVFIGILVFFRVLVALAMRFVNVQVERLGLLHVFS
jgi:hypothetical protein